MRNKLCHIVDVRDLAEALLLVYEAPGASGRHICELLDSLKSNYPDYPCIAK